MERTEKAPRRMMDRIYDFLGIESDDRELDAEEEAAAYETPSRNEPRRGRIVSLPGVRRGPDATGGSGMNVVVQRPGSFDDVQQVADWLKNRQPVILSVELVPKEVARRLVDFVSGAAYALDGRMHRLGESLFLFTPSNIGIDVEGGQYDD